MKIEIFPAIFLLTNLLCALALIKLSPVPCNNKPVEKLSKLAITYINEDRTEGYKFALNRISNVHLHAQGPAGNVYYLLLDVLETKCHVRSPKPWKRCDVRPFMETQISGSCNTTILHTAGGYSYLYSYDCTLMPDPPEKLQQTCPTCPLLLPVDSPKAVHAAGLTLLRFNTQSTLPTSMALQNLTRASVQNKPVPATYVEYTVQECRKAYVGMCVPADKRGDPAGFCMGAVYGDIGQPDVEVSCEIFHPQGTDVVYDATRPQPPMISEVATLVPDIPISVTKVPVIIPSSSTASPPILDDSQPPLFDFVPPSSSESQETPGFPLSPYSPGVPDSSSEEYGGTVVRPPFNFRYRPLRRRRHSSVTAKPPHTPVFLAEFPSSPSPFRSCPGLSRYTTA
ncbi:alpha-2-HS-glycoprotein [Esox lucius]|uniref:Cystatin fetuin-B-type domain-containing protein n=1 Tax=Esox lucius TaxID=8010 RepID=A0A3P9ADM3_ESOLU|nr:alpha-2-HS-glycoprotein [Esox lucius]